MTGDVLLYQTADGGDIIVENGLVRMAGGLETAAYLCLFGGNEQDDGRLDNAVQWWGNYGEVPERQQRSETQYLLNVLPAVSSNLRRLEEAAQRDLSRLVDAGAATSVEVVASMPGVNRVMLTASIDANGEPRVIEYIENWMADI